MGRGSKKHQRILMGGKDKHHKYWPKKFYGRNVIMLIPYSIHHAYHNYFMGHCKSPFSRTCSNNSFCHYEGICCYAGTQVEFGKKVPWVEVSS